MQGLLQEEYRSVHEASKITFGFWSISALSKAIQYLRFLALENSRLCQVAHRIESLFTIFQVRLSYQVPHQFTLSFSWLLEQSHKPISSHLLTLRSLLFPTHLIILLLTNLA